MRKNKIFIIIVFKIIIVCLFLAAWQINRYQEKQKINQAIKNSLFRPEIYNKLSLKPYNSYIISGYYDFSKQILLDLRTYNGQIGMYVYTIFITDNNQYLLVNRGFVPQDKIHEIQTDKISPKQKIQVFALPRPKLSIFAAKNKPEQNQWYSLDISAIEKYLAVNLEDFYYKQVASLTTVSAKYPIITFNENYQLNNIHLKYIYFWFLLSFTFAIMLIFFNKKSQSCQK